MPSLTGLEHDVHDHEQLAHAGGDDDLGELTGGLQALSDSGHGAGKASVPPGQRHLHRLAAVAVLAVAGLDDHGAHTGRNGNAM